MSFFLVEKLSITVQKFSKCPKNGNDRLRKGNLRRRREARKRAKNFRSTGSKIAHAGQPRIIATRYCNGPLSQFRLMLRASAIKHLLN